MPELPEVETVARGIAPVMEGRCLTRVVTRRADLRIPLPPDMSNLLKGRRVEHVGRRAKYLLVRVEGGLVLVIHLGMSGRMTIVPGKSLDDLTPATHDHVLFEIDHRDSILFNDPRRFGLMTVVAADALDRHPMFARMGPEPLGNEFSVPGLSAALHGRKSSIKAALLDQRVVAGLGNIYVCEALFRSGISPRRTGASVAGRRAERLVPAIRSVLLSAIEAGGSTLRDYARADGELGYFQHAFSVYDREGQSCKTPGCGKVIQRMVQQGRSTFYCPGCQR